MATLQGFNAQDVDPQVPFDAVPAGKYQAVIIASEQKQNSAGTGSYLQLEFEILDEPLRGRKVWERLSLDHPNATAVKIARAKLSSICRALGVMQPQDSAELHNLPLVITVACRKRKDTDYIVNEIKSFAARETAVGVPPQATTNVAPWRRG